MLVLGEWIWVQEFEWGVIAKACTTIVVGQHLIKPSGFKVDDAKPKCAGLDYWPYVGVKVHGSWAEFQKYLRQQEGKQ